MQTLVFNTTTREVKLYNSGNKEHMDMLEMFTEVPTVRIADGYYEVMKKFDDTKNIPVLRVPIANTNMLIER